MAIGWILFIGIFVITVAFDKNTLLSFFQNFMGIKKSGTDVQKNEVSSDNMTSEQE